ncbi:MAG: DUF4167 domain-containing protein [Alphaproteobacteria bacterium]
MMRQGPNNNHRRMRGRGNGGGGGGNKQRHISAPRTQTFDSNGPGGRIRGNAYQVYERYLVLARDAQTSGDRITAENYFQHAEHYFRIIAASNEGQFKPNPNTAQPENTSAPQPSGQDQPQAPGGDETGDYEESEQYQPT